MKKKTFAPFFSFHKYELKFKSSSLPQKLIHTASLTSQTEVRQLGMDIVYTVNQAQKGAAWQGTTRAGCTLSPVHVLLHGSPSQSSAASAAGTECVMEVTGHFQSKSCYRLISKHFLAYYAIYHDENYIGLLKATC